MSTHSCTRATPHILTTGPPVPYLVLNPEPLYILHQRVISHRRHTDGAGDAVYAGHGREEGGPVCHVAHVYALWK